MPKVYLAGPAVFRPDATERFASDARTCRARGFDALIPFDETLTAADRIFAGNVLLIDSADAVIADISPFRGPHCDVGTAWETGYAIAKGVPVFAYSQDPRLLTARIAGTDGRDHEGCLIEDFGLAENLMLVSALADRTVHPTLAAALGAAAAHLQAAKAVRS